MTKAIWKGVVIVESDKCVEGEGNKYFPPDSVKMKYLKKSYKTYVCLWKGNAIYFDVVIDGEVNKNAAWSYPKPRKLLKR